MRRNRNRCVRHEVSSDDSCNAGSKGVDDMHRRRPGAGHRLPGNGHVRGQARNSGQDRPGAQGALYSRVDVERAVDELEKQEAAQVAAARQPSESGRNRKAMQRP